MPDETMVRIDLDFFGALCIPIEECPIQKSKEYAIINRAIATKWWHDSSELAQVKAERDAARRETESIRELMNLHNLGGWTDAEGVMHKLTAARERIARLEGLLRLVHAPHPQPEICAACDALSPSTPKEPT